MTGPDTSQADARRWLRQIRAGAARLDSWTGQESDPQWRQDRSAAATGAWSFAAVLADDIEQGRVTEPLLRQAELVARATEMGGWLSASMVAMDREVLSVLIDKGFFVFSPRDPGRTLDCFRLVS